MRLLLAVCIGLCMLLKPTEVDAKDGPDGSTDESQSTKSFSSMEPVLPPSVGEPGDNENQPQQESPFTDDDVARYIHSCYSFSGQEIPFADSAEPYFCEVFSKQEAYETLKDAVALVKREGSPRASVESDLQSINRLAASEHPSAPPAGKAPRETPEDPSEPLVDENGLCMRGSCPSYQVLPALANTPVLLQLQLQKQQSKAERAAAAAADAHVLDALQHHIDADDAVDADGELELMQMDKADEGRRHHRHRHNRRRSFQRLHHMLKGAAGRFLSPNNDEFGFTQAETEDDEGNPMLPAAQAWPNGIVPWNFVPIGMGKSPDRLNEAVTVPPPVTGPTHAPNPGVRVNAPIAMAVWEQATCVWYEQSPTAGVTNRFLFISGPETTHPAGECATRGHVGHNRDNTQVMWMSDPAVPSMWNYDPTGGAGTWTITVPGPTITLSSDWWWNGEGAPELKAAMQHAFGCQFDNVDVTRIARGAGGGFLVRFRFANPNLVITSMSITMTANGATVVPVMVGGVATPNQFRVRRRGGFDFVEFGLTLTLAAQNSDALSPGMTAAAIETAIDNGFGPSVTVSVASGGRMGFDLLFNKGDFRGVNVPALTMVPGGGGTLPTNPLVNIAQGAGSDWPDGCTPPDIAHEMGHGLGFQHTQSRPDFAARGAAASSSSAANFPFRLVGSCPLDSQYQPRAPWVQTATYPGKSQQLTKRQELVQSIMLYDSGIEVNPWPGMVPADLVILTAQLHMRHNTLGKIDTVLLNRFYSCFPIPFRNGAQSGGHDKLWSNVGQRLGIWLNKFTRQMMTSAESIRFVPNARQSIVFGGRPSGGQFTLTFDSWTSPVIPFDGNTEQLSLNIRDGLTDLASGREVFTKVVGNAVHVTFLGRWAGFAQTAMTCSARATVRIVKVGGTAATRDKFAVGVNRNMRTAFGMTEFGDFAAMHTTMTTRITLDLHPAGGVLGLLFGLRLLSTVTFLVEPLWTLEEFRFAVEDRLVNFGLTVTSLELNGAPLTAANPTDTITDLHVIAGVTVVVNTP